LESEKIYLLIAGSSGSKPRQSFSDGRQWSATRGKLKRKLQPLGEGEGDKDEVLVAQNGGTQTRHIDIRERYSAY